MKSNLMNKAAGGLLVLSVMSLSAMAQMDPNMEKCFGIAKAGKNNCSSNKSAHSCAGQAVKDGDGKDFVVVPKGTCDRIVGGSTQPKE